MGERLFGGVNGSTIPLGVGIREKNRKNLGNPCKIRVSRRVKSCVPVRERVR